MTTVPTPDGGSLSQTPDGTVVMDQRGGMSNLGVSINMSESQRTAASTQAQTIYNTALSQSEAANQYSITGLRQISDFGRQHSESSSSGHASTHTLSGGLTRIAQDIDQSVESFAKEKHISHENALQVLGQVYADAKQGIGIGPNEISIGVSGNLSLSRRNQFGSLYNEAKRFSTDHNLNQSIDTAQRVASESHYRDSNDASSHAAHSIASSFEQADSLRSEATSNFSKAQSFSTLASQTQENAASINASYTQAFYEWVRQQPNGQKILSEAAHDPTLLQHYANDFVAEKTAQTLADFGQAHHLNEGEAGINAAYHRNKNSLASHNHLATDRQQFDTTVNQQASSLANTMPNSALRDHVAVDLNHLTTTLDSKENTLQTDNKLLKQEVKNKVELPGKIIHAAEKAALGMVTSGVKDLP